MEEAKKPITASEVRDYLLPIQGKEITLDQIRKDFNVLPGSKSWSAVRNILFQLSESDAVKPSGKKDGTYKVITKVVPVSVYGVPRERREPFPLVFPRDMWTFDELLISKSVVVREGDLILISGLSNYGKTTLCINFLAENLDKKPVLMGNEYTTIVEDEYVPAPRFMARLDAMGDPESGWVEWVDEKCQDKFTLLPVRDDYAEHIVKDKINIIDWINIDTGEHYLIGSILEKIKRNLGRGVAIIAIQKKEGELSGRGGQFTKDFADLELLIDRFGKTDVLMTIGKVKEATTPIAGNTYAYSIARSGTQIVGFRQVTRCRPCKGTGYIKNEPCSTCQGKKFVDVIET